MVVSGLFGLMYSPLLAVTVTVMSPSASHRRCTSFPVNVVLVPGVIGRLELLLVYV